MELPATPPHSFDLEDKEKWLDHLYTNGYVVVRNVANQAEIDAARQGFWQCIESTSPGVVRDNLSTWGKWRVDPRGIILNGDLLHCAGAWTVRGLPRVHAAFATIWKDEDLIVSFDSTIIWRPWVGHSFAKPRLEGLHVDQNPFTKPDLCCVQGMVPLIDVTDSSGGLAVVSGSHREAPQKHWTGLGDFCVVLNNKAMQRRAHLVAASAGDLILWDSRTIHGGRVGTQAVPTSDGLVRLSQTVCMVPRKTASAEVQAWRRQAFLKGTGTTHWPNEERPTCFASDDYVPIALTEHQTKLL